MESNSVEMVRTVRKKNKIFPVAAVVVLVILVITGVRALGGKGYEKPFKYMEKGINNCDADAFLQAFHPSVYEEYAPTDEDMIDEFGEDSMQIHFEILDKEKMSDDELGQYKEEYGKVKTGYRVKAKVSVSKELSAYDELMGDGSNYSEIKWVNVIKLDGKWYFADEVW